MADKTRAADRPDVPDQRQDPYPPDPTNELLDGDDLPPGNDLPGVEVTDARTALRTVGDAEGVIPPPAFANLEVAKAREKHLRAWDESLGLDPQVGVTARAEALREASEAATRDLKVAAEQRRAAAETVEDKAEAKTKAPQGRKAQGRSTT